MALENKLGLQNSLELAKYEEKISKKKVVQLFETGKLDKMSAGTVDTLKKELKQVVDWSKVEKEDYLLAMERSPIRDIEIKYVLKQALTDQINDREIYMKGIDHSYYYEGYTLNWIILLII